MKNISNFAGQNWLITPAAPVVEEHPPVSVTNAEEEHTTLTLTHWGHISLQELMIRYVCWFYPVS